MRVKQALALRPAQAGLPAPASVRESGVRANLFGLFRKRLQLSLGTSG